MPEKGGRRRTRRHNQYHRRRGATPEVSLPHAIDKEAHLFFLSPPVTEHMTDGIPNYSVNTYQR